MLKVFYADKIEYPNSEKAVQHLLSLHFGINNAKIAKTENGKPYLQTLDNTSLFFSISHTRELLFIAFSDKNIGIDTEKLTRDINYQAIIKKFTTEEQNQIQTKNDFLHYWTAKESTVKWLGETLATDLKHLTFSNGHMHHKKLPLPIFLNFQQIDEHLVCICSEYNNDWEFEKF